MSTSDSPRALVLHARYASFTQTISYYDDWLDAFLASPLWSARALDLAAKRDRERLPDLLHDCDAVVVLHSATADSLSELASVSGLLRERAVPLVTFVGNEVNLPESPIAAKRSLLLSVSPDIVATQLPLDAGQYLWADVARHAVIPLPHALNGKAFRFEVPHKSRSLDIGVRGIRYGAFLGDDDRNRLMDAVATLAGSGDLAVDVSQDRFDRVGWAAYLNSTRTTFSTEAGSWFLERDDRSLEQALAQAKRTSGVRHIVPAGSRARRLFSSAPEPVKKPLRSVLSRVGVHSASTAVEVAAADAPVSQLRERPPFYGKCISSRHFDAAGAGTAQVLMEGRYNEILMPGDNYVELRHDLSNWDDVLEQVRDRTAMEVLARRTHDLMHDRHLYRHRLQALREAIDPLLI